jgi:general secretion pathway protein B
MSIILDALRKSETARRRNEAPELFASMPTAAAPTRTRPTWPLWAVGGIGVVSLALALWLTMKTNAPSGTDPAATAGIDDIAQNDRRALAEATAASQAAAQAAAYATANAAANPAPRSATPPIASTPPAVAIAPPSTPAMPAPVREQRIQAVPIAAPAIANAPNVVAPPQRATIASMPPPIAASPQPASSQPASSQSASSQSFPPPPATFRSPQNDGPLALADLDSGTRKQLPPLKLSMHVWNDAAAQRFVILDGQRLREGDVLGDVVVERITRDGATLSWRGTALKLEWR